MKKKLFATGMGGCVGHYLMDELKKFVDLDFVFLIRNPKKIRYDLTNINVIEDEFKNIKRYKSIIKNCNYIIHLLADWGGEEGNFQETLDFFECIDENNVEKILYFSTASILGSNGQPSPITKYCGTPYIRGKYKFYEKLKVMPHYKKTIILFLTWTLGGDKNHPESHAVNAIKTLSKWIDIIKFFSVDINFHFIHAKDIATISAYLLKNNLNNKEFVLGSSPISADQFIAKLCAILNKKNPFIKFPLPIDVLLKLTSIFGRKISAWDKYCIDNRKNIYSVITPSNFGLNFSYPEIECFLREIF